MIKSIQLKIVMIFMLLGIVFINGLGVVFVYDLNTINDAIVSSNSQNPELQNVISEQMTRNKKYYILFFSCFYNFYYNFGNIY